MLCGRRNNDHMIAGVHLPMHQCPSHIVCRGRAVGGMFSPGTRGVSANTTDRTKYNWNIVESVVLHPHHQPHVVKFTCSSYVVKFKLQKGLKCIFLCDKQWYLSLWLHLPILYIHICTAITCHQLHHDIQFKTTNIYCRPSNQNQMIQWHCSSQVVLLELQRWRYILMVVMVMVTWLLPGKTNNYC